MSGPLIAGVEVDGRIVATIRPGRVVRGRVIRTIDEVRVEVDHPAELVALVGREVVIVLVEPEP